MILETTVEKDLSVLRVCIGITGEDARLFKDRLQDAPQLYVIVRDDKLYMDGSLYPYDLDVKRWYEGIRESCNSIIRPYWPLEHAEIKIEAVNGTIQWKKDGELVVVPDLYEIPQDNFALLTEILSKSS